MGKQSDPITPPAMSGKDAKRVLTHLGLVALAAVLSEVMKQTNLINLGAYQSFLVPMISVVLKATLVLVQSTGV